jgi:hypothetical protein
LHFVRIGESVPWLEARLQSSGLGVSFVEFVLGVCVGHEPVLQLQSTAIEAHLLGHLQIDGPPLSKNFVWSERTPTMHQSTQWDGETIVKDFEKLSGSGHQLGNGE